ncbi:MAG: dethiobiotin synthase [Nitrospirae bacterium]|nr:dethiobiotin synthase [Candidatus Manganitrophaceae bacterium]
MEEGIFIAGTDTGVGKTVIAGAIARALSLTGVDVGVMKPVETGCQKKNGKLVPSDATYLKAAARTRDPIKWITPYRFQSALSPRAAALQEKKEIKLEEVLRAYDQLRRRHAFIIVEGAGGLLVPLTAHLDLLDLITLLNLPVLLVGRSGLGTLNHTLLTLRCGSTAGIRFTGIIFNQITPSRSLADETNPASLAERTDIPLLGVLPYFKKSGKKEREIERSEKLLMANQLLKRTVLGWTYNRSSDSGESGTGVGLLE